MNTSAYALMAVNDLFGWRIFRDPHLPETILNYLTAEKLGTLEDILAESKFKRDATGRWVPPRLIATELVSAY